MSKRANIYYLEHCRVLVNQGVVNYVTPDADKQQAYWNIPIANTSVVLFGTGTSVTQQAMREFSKAGVTVGFCGGGGTPLFSGTEPALDIDIEWCLPQNEYRPTNYMQAWIKFWLDDNKRLAAAKHLQINRIHMINKMWTHYIFTNQDFKVPEDELKSLTLPYIDGINNAKSQSDLLALEGELTKKLYKKVCRIINFDQDFKFTRAKHGSGTDKANNFLDHGNYLAYGLAASAIWVLGLSHSLAILHGKTRRGALVFDAADLIKDALILPQAFISANNEDTEKEFRMQCLENFSDVKAMDLIFDELKEIAKLGLNVCSNQ